MCREVPTPTLSSAAEAGTYVEKLLLPLYPLLLDWNMCREARTVLLTYPLLQELAYV